MVIFVQLGSQSSQMKMVPASSSFSWQSYNEETASADDDDTTTMNGLWEQINVTRDATDYLWYLTEWVQVLVLRTSWFSGASFRVVAACFLAYSLPFLNISWLFSVKIDADEGFLKSGQNPLLTIFSAGHALHVFINGQLAGGLNRISLLRLTCYS